MVGDYHQRSNPFGRPLTGPLFAAEQLGQRIQQQMEGGEPVEVPEAPEEKETCWVPEAESIYP